MPITDLDVAIIGGGPAGSAAALAVDVSRHRVGVFEKSEFPRHHIGESLLARTVPYFKRLGIWEKLHERGYVQKPGALFVWGGRRDPMILDMPEPGYAFQVLRADFDHALLSEAKERGARVWHGRRLQGFEVRDDHVLLRGTAERGPGWQARARYLVDATGGVRYTARALKLRFREYDGPRVAVSAYFDGARPIEEPHSGRIITEACESGWFWFIPLPSGLTSVGLVTDARRLREAADPLSAFHEELRTAPITQGHLRVATMRSGWQAIRYANSIVEEEAWQHSVLRVGDAAMFVDPLFSTGVHGAVFSGYMAGACLGSVLDGDVEEARARVIYNRKCADYFARTRETVRLLYGFHPGKTRFWAERTVHGMTPEEAADSTALLGVPGAAIFRSMTDSLPMPEHFLDAIRQVRMPAPLEPIAPGTALRLAPGVDIRREPVFKGGKLTAGFAVGHQRGRTSEVTVSGGGRQERLLTTLMDSSRSGASVRLRPEHSAVLASTLVSTGNALAAREELDSEGNPETSSQCEGARSA